MSADKRTVSTDALATLGTIIDDTAGRDAIHLAVEPVIAGEELRPGENEIHKHPITTFWSFIYEAAELYKEKATEELRKENERMKIELSNYAFQIDRAKRDRDKAESESERLKESNKELVEALDEHKNLLKSMGVTIKMKL